MESSNRSGAWQAALIGVLLGLGLAPALSRASVAPAGSPLSRGVHEFEARKFDAALREFRQAARMDPADVRPPLLAGACLNRIGRPAEALVELKQAQALGSDEPVIRFELGWAYLALDQWQEALGELTAYDLARPGRGQTSEFVGRAYLGLGNLALAESKLREALARDPALAPTAQIYLALVRRRRGDVDRSTADLQAAIRNLPGLGREAALPPALPTARAGSPWAGDLTLGAGHDSNVIALGAGVPLPADISSQQSGFLREELEVSRRVLPGPVERASVGYRFVAQQYQKVPTFDLQDHTVSLDCALRTERRVDLSLRLASEFTRVGGADFRRARSLRPALTYRPGKSSSLELAYLYSQSDFFFPTIAVQDRDSDARTLSLTDVFRLHPVGVDGRIGYWHTSTNARGSDFDLASDGVLLVLSRALWKRTAAQLGCLGTRDRYDANNSLAGTFGFEFPRQDELSEQWALVQGALWRGYLRVRYARLTAHSNISFFEYVQRTTSAAYDWTF